MSLFYILYYFTLSIFYILLYLHLNILHYSPFPKKKKGHYNILNCLWNLENYPQHPRNLPQNQAPLKPPHLWQHRKMLTLGTHHFLLHILSVSNYFYILLFIYHKGFAIRFLHWSGWILQYCSITNMMCFIKVNKI